MEDYITDPSEITFALCLSMSRTLITGVEKVSGGNIIEALIFSTSVMLKKIDSYLPAVHRKIRHDIIKLIHQKAISHNLDNKNLVFQDFIERRLIWYWREYSLLKIDSDLNYPSIMAYSFYCEPYREDSICSNPVLVSFLRKRIEAFDELVSDNFIALMEYIC